MSWRRARVEGCGAAEVVGGDSNLRAFPLDDRVAVRVSHRKDYAFARHFGHIPGNPVGTAYPSRRSLADAGVHRPLQHGISGAGAEGADSIVVSGGYEDDEDYGDLIIYTGPGGRDPATGAQIADQEFEVQNLALVKSEAEGLPVRVVRGAGGETDFSPSSGLRYDGLFRVEESWRERASEVFTSAATG